MQISYYSKLLQKYENMPCFPANAAFIEIYGGFLSAT